METTAWTTLNSILMSYFIFGLVLVRVGALVVFAPFFGAQQFPVMVRVAMGAFFSLCLFSSASATWQAPQILNTADIALLVMQELAIGLVIGFLASLVFMAAQLAGQLVGTQIGFAMANIVDPMADQEVSLIGFLKVNLAMMIFLTLNLHLYLIWIMKLSYEVVGIGQLVFVPFLQAANEGVLYHSDNMFSVAVRLAMPVLLVMLLNSTVEGFITRTMPQMNIMVLGMPLRVVVGLTVMMFAIPGMCYALAGTGIEETWLTRGEDGILREMLNKLVEVVEAFAPPQGA